jgi:hypoxanthine phosphoribosyltransferase
VIKVLLSEEDIARQVALLARQVSEYYAPLVSIPHPLVFMPVLKGASVFGSDLLRQLTIPVRLEFLRSSSYRLGTVSGAIEMDVPETAHLSDHHLLLVEDIIDTGKTASHILAELRRFRPRSLKICALLDKPSRRSAPVEVDFCGTTIADRFVIGYGMDLAERYRELPFIGELDPCTY